MSTRGKSKQIHQFPGGDFIALGSKTGRSDANDPKRPSTAHPKAGTSAIADRKREIPVPVSALAAKKAKLVGSATIPRRRSSDHSSDAWESVATDNVGPDNILHIMYGDDYDSEKIEGYLCGAIKQLKHNRVKPDPSMVLSLLYVAKLQPSLFIISDCVVEALCSLLKRDASLAFKSKGNASVSVLAANLLMSAYQDEKDWPELFIKVYLDDAVGERLWVDNDECKGFVDNICTAFNTRLPAKTLLYPDHTMGGLASRSDVCPSPPIGSAITGVNLAIEEPMDIGSPIPGDSKEKQNINVIPRYAETQEEVETIVLEIVKDQLNRRQHTDSITRNFLRALTQTCGLREVRSIVLSRLEMWIQNPKVTKPAQELFMSVCINTTVTQQSDLDIISQLIRIRLKTKPLINIYLTGIRELACAHPENLAAVLKHTVYNELSLTRNPNNMTMLGVMMQISSEKSATILADVFQELLIRKEDYLWALRGILREIVRALRGDVNLPVLANGLMQDRKEAAFIEFEHKERMFLSLVDLITLCVFLAITPSVREAGSLAARGDKKDVHILQHFQSQVAHIQCDAISWMYNVVPRMYHPSLNEYTHSLHKMLFMEPAEQYYNKDSWPPESERQLLLRLSSEVPVLQNTLLRLFVIGLSKDHPLNPADTLELGDQLIKRAAGLHMEGYAVLEMNKVELIDLIFNLSEYHHPDHITLPAGYQPPKLAVTSLYWKSWIMLLIASAHNPNTFGAMAWENYPMLRVLIEMCITNHFTFPPPTMATREELDELKSKELQLTSREKHEILEFEIHLAAASTKATITEQTSLLIAQLTTSNPIGHPRSPPSHILEQLKALNTSLKLGHLLCRSRHPDFLLEIIQRQGTTSQAMPWLADLVESSEGAFHLLPVQCLCEFMLNESLQLSIPVSEEPSTSKMLDKSTKVKEKQKKQKMLLFHLQTMLQDPNQDINICNEILEYFLRRLSSPQTISRNQAVQGLKMVLLPIELSGEDEGLETELMDSGLEVEGLMATHVWLLKHLASLPHFHTLSTQVTQALRQACQIENDPTTISSYIQFLARHGINDPIQDLSELALDMSQLIVERSTVIGAILPQPGNTLRDQCNVDTLQALLHIFIAYMQKAREPSKEAIMWSENQDQIRVRWSTGEEATMHILVVHAMVILLTLGPMGDKTLYFHMLDIWFPANQEPPRAFLLDTTEEALLLPDWLKLRMIRCNSKVLVDTALKDLEPNQLVLFIQSFGIPVDSMSRLLETLDHAVELSEYSVSEAVMDKTYMSQLVEVQWRRGARGGEKFAQLLQLKIDDAPVVAERKYVSRPLPKPPAKPPTISADCGITVSQIPNVLHQIFDTGFLPKMATQEKQIIFRNLQKVLQKELMGQEKGMKMTSAVIFALDQLANRTINLQGFAQNIPYSCGLFRLLTTNIKGSDKMNSKLYSKLLYTCNLLMMSDVISSCALGSILKSFVEKNKQKKMKVKRVMNEDPLQVLLKTPSDSLEQVGWELMEQHMKQNNITPLITTMTQLLLRDNERDVSKETGIYVDWLATLEPEIIASCPQQQISLLFSRKKSQAIYRPYLLSLLSHQTSWKTLMKCLQYLLVSFSKELDPTCVLDFLTTCTSNPRLWQGRDKFVPKHHQSTKLFKLEEKQLWSLIEYIIEEAVLLCESKDQKEAIHTMESRLPLIMCCCNDDKSLVTSILNGVKMKWKKDTGCDKEMAHHMLLLLYLQLPHVISLLRDEENLFSIAANTSTSHCELDTPSHTILSALAMTQAGKECGHRMQDLELAARKMAAEHPILFLRQLPMLASSLQGRTHLDYSIFRSRNHLNLFNHILGLLELLKHHLYVLEHGKALEQIFDAYFELLESHSQIRDLGNLVNRLMLLLQNFISHDDPRALKYINKHSILLAKLQNVYPDMASLRFIVSGTSFPQHESDQSTVTMIIPSGMYQMQNVWNQKQLSIFITKLSRRDNCNEIIATLQELDSVTSKKASLLEPFANILQTFISHFSEPVRSISYSLLIRYLKCSPDEARGCIGAYIQCLEHPENEVIASAVERLPELVILAQESASVILKHAFRLGYTSLLNTAPQLTKSVALLNMQNGV